MIVTNKSYNLSLLNDFRREDIDGCYIAACVLSIYTNGKCTEYYLLYQYKRYGESDREIWKIS